MSDHNTRNKTKTHPARPAHRRSYRLLSCLGAICLIAGTISLVQWRDFQSHAVVTVGKVVSRRQNTLTYVREKYTGSKIEQRTESIPVIEFHTTDGRGFQFEGPPLYDVMDLALLLQEQAASSNTYPPDLSQVDRKAKYVGDWVEVRYDARHPESAIINVFSELWLVPIAWLLAGSALTTIAVYRAKRPA